MSRQGRPKNRRPQPNKQANNQTNKGRTNSGSKRPASNAKSKGASSNGPRKRGTALSGQHRQEASRRNGAANGADAASTNGARSNGNHGARSDSLREYAASSVDTLVEERPAASEPAPETNTERHPVPLEHERDLEPHQPGRDLPAVATNRPTYRQRRRSLRRLFAALALTIVLAVVGGASGYAVAEAQPDMYAAESEVVLETLRPQIDRFLDTQVVLAESRSVAVEAAALSGLDVDDFVDASEVDTVAGSQVLRFSMVMEDGEVARIAADHWVEVYLTRLTIDSSPVIRRVYDNRITELREARAEIEEELSVYELANARAEALDQVPPNPTEERRLALESSELQGQISGLESQIIQLDVERLNEAEASVVSEAYILSDRVAPTPITAAALGILLGLTLAAGVIVALGLHRSALVPSRSSDR